MSCKITLISTFDVNQNFDFAFVCLNAAKESCVTLNVEINSWLFVFFSSVFLASKQHDDNDVLLDNSNNIIAEIEFSEQLKINGFQLVFITNYKSFWFTWK
jgi:hypothetical protein